MKNLIKVASKNISSQSDIEIVEIHHNKKKIYRLEQLFLWLNQFKRVLKGLLSFHIEKKIKIKREERMKLVLLRSEVET